MSVPGSPCGEMINRSPGPGRVATSLYNSAPGKTQPARPLRCAGFCAAAPPFQLNVLYEENGAFKVGTILADQNTSLQVEALHGKRSKIKSSAVLLRFAEPPVAELLPKADAVAADIDADFLWQCCGEPEFGFSELAREYCGRTPSPVEAAGILLKLHSAPMYFYRKGRGRYKAAPPETLRAALAGLERKRRLKEQIDAWAARLLAGDLPAEFGPLLPQLLYRPDRNRPETKALEQACDAAGLTAVKLLERCGALPSSHDYHLNRFLFEYFPGGTEFADAAPVGEPGELRVAEVQAFSLDDVSTTEIDDAFSVTPLPGGRYRIGVHIAAPGLGFDPGTEVDRQARERLSTVYIPGRKLTMLPPAVIERYSLAEHRACPAVSLYLDVRETDFAIENQHTAIERVPVAANLRHQQLQLLEEAFLADVIPGEVPFSGELHLLWRFALALEARRGKPSVAPERSEFIFRIDGEHVAITERKRGTPLDKLVAELMIATNSTWGKLLDDHGVPGIYRVQSNGKVRMTTAPSLHQGLGITHYAWMTSPLRRYADLVNQWQLLALLEGEQPPFGRNSDVLLGTVSAFEATYAAYAEFQQQMERYWCLRWLAQEQARVVTAEVLRENAARIERLPLVAKVPSLPDLAPGTRVELEIGRIDLLESSLEARFRRVVSASST